MTGLTPKFTGQVFPCCVYYGFDLPQESILEAWNSDRIKRMRVQLANNIWPKECVVCKDSEARGNLSFRQTFNAGRSNSDVPMRSDGHINGLPKLLNLFCSKICNFKCRMCNQTNCKLLDSESIELGDVETVLENAYLLENHKFTDELLYIVENNDYTCFEISGGEPLIDKSVYHFLDQLIEHDLAHKTSIQISTNGSKSVIGPFTIFDYLDKFKHFHLTVSVDGIGRYSEYGRTNFKWSTVSRCLKKLVAYSTRLDNFTMNVHSIINVYSLPGLADLIRFCDRRRIDVFLNDVCNPHLNIGILPEEYLLSHLKKIHRWSTAAKKDKFPKFLKAWIPGSSLNRNYNIEAFHHMRQCIDNAFTYQDKDMWKKRFTEVNQIQDRNRGTRFADVYKDLSNWYISE